MLPQNIKIDISGFSIPEKQLAANDLYNGCFGNPSFSFSGTSLSDLGTRQGDYATKESTARRTGDYADVKAAQDAGDLLVFSYNLVASQVNIQAAHDVTKLRSSGGILTSEGATIGILAQAVIAGWESKIPMEIVIELITMANSIGTMVYWKDLTANTPQEMDFFAQKHFVHLDGLISGHDYLITVAHKGTMRQVIVSESITAHCK